ncbi:MAG: HAMP domain-containing histidine kinase, partial [Acidimicrobiia bacterium]|nr:HAMP domain-containing histidine kinase [Acidimicrobiia bacterium]
AMITEEERPKLLEMAVQQADEVLILIEDLLAAARVESGTLNVAKVRVDLEAQVRQVMEGLSASSGDAVEVATTPVLGLGDPSRSRQIIRNLVTNAIRYGGPSIRITSDHVGDRVAVIVSDDGDGIPPAERDSIFDAYSQVKGRRDVEASVGIGLHVSKQLAELMGGTLTYDHVDGWSLFRLEMPLFTSE